MDFPTVKPCVEVQWKSSIARFSNSHHIDNHTYSRTMPVTQILEDLAEGKSATREMTRSSGPDDREHHCDLTAVTSGKSEQGLDKGKFGDVYITAVGTIKNYL